MISMQSISCGLLLPMRVCVCGVHVCVNLLVTTVSCIKMPNRFKCHLTNGLGWAQGTMCYVRARIPAPVGGRGNFYGGLL